MTAPEPSAAAAPTVPISGYLLAAGGAVLFSSKAVLIKLAYAEAIDAVTLLALRMALSVPIFVAVGLWTVRRELAGGAARPAGRDLLKAGAVGVLGYWFASYTDFKGLETLSPQFERLILFTYPLFVVVFGALFFRLPFRWSSLGAFAISYAGLAVIFVEDFRTEGTAVAIGAAYVLSSAVAFAFYQLLAKPLIGKLGAPLFTSVAMTAASVAVMAQFAAVRPMEALAVGERGLAVAAAVAILATVLPSYMMSAALQRISAQANATIATVSPVATLVLAVVVLGEVVTSADLVGTGLVLTGVGAFTLLDRRR